MSNSVMKIGVIGAGNIGTAMAALLSQSDADIWLTARGVRLEQISQSGVFLNDRGTEITGQPRTGATLDTAMDAVFVCVKSQSLVEAISANADAISPDTLVIPMVNGLPFWFFASKGSMGDVPRLDPDQRLAQLLTPQQVLGAVLLMTVKMDAEAKAHSSNTPTLSLGAVAPGVDSAKLAQLVEVLETSGVRTIVEDAIRQKVMVKLLANFATNPLSALTGAMLDEIGKTPELRDISTSLADEFRHWATTQGFELPSNQWLVDLLLDAGPFPTSMLQDAQTGKPLELDAICRAPWELARQNGVEMPLLGALLQAISDAQALPLPAGERTEFLKMVGLKKPAMERME